MFYGVFVVLVLLLTTTGGIEEGARVKRPRAESSAVGREPAQALDAPDPGPDPPTAPPNFLSPSVKEYLELGMAIPGKPGTDYPVLGAVPYTNFYCDEQPYPGFFADMETRCQAWHYCDIDGRQASFLCPNGTVFSQAVASCDWWFNVHCALSPSLYPLNARLYRRRRKSNKPLKPKPHRVVDQQMLDEIFLDYNPMEEVATFGLPTGGRDISIRPIPRMTTTPVQWDLFTLKKHMEDYEHEFIDS